MNKKFYLLGLCAAASAAVANAQQLPNVGFEEWKAGDDMGVTKYMGMTNATNPRPYDTKTGVTEPSSWNGSNVNQILEFYFIEKETVAENNLAVRLVNKFAGLNIFGQKIGDEAPGFLTFGTPWVYAETNTDNCDGGAFGGVEFTYKPDAIKGKFKYTQGDAPETSHIIAYLWNGTFTSEIGSVDSKQRESCNDVDRAILGKSNAGTVTGDGKLVASCDYEITTTNGIWQEIIAPLAYVEGAGEPTKMNVIISAADYWTRANIKENTTLAADDVDFVYYSTLKALEVNGETVELGKGKYEYSMTGSELPTAGQVVAATKSQFAEAAVTVDAENAQVRIVVTNQGGKDVDGETSHTYVLQYEKAEIEGTPYAGYLNIEMAGEPLAYNQAANIEIAETGEGVCTFMLPDFQFMGLSLGDIVVENVSIIEGEDGVKTYSGSTPEDGDLVLVPNVITASVSLSGTIDASGNCDFDINVLWKEKSLPISVTFTTEMVGTDYEGYLNVSSEALGGQLVDNQKDAIRIAQTSDNTCTFMLNDLTLSILGSDITLGDIVVDNVNVVETDGVKHYNGTAEGLQLVVGPVNVEVEGTIDANNICDFKIDVDWNGMPINVTFTANKIPAGIEGVSGDAVAVYGVVGAVSVNGYNGVVEVYAADGRLVKSVMVDGNAEISLNGGLYIVRAGSEAYKVFVK